MGTMQCLQRRSWWNPLGLLLLLALASSVTRSVYGAKKSGSKRIIEIALSEFEDVSDIELLKAGKPIVGTLEPGEAYPIRFGIVPGGKGRYPSLLVSLTATNPLGDVDVLCAPFPWISAGQRLFPWTSDSTQGIDEVFISAQSSEYRASVTNITVSKEEGKEVIQAAAFTCIVVDGSRAGSAFELELDVQLDDVTLVSEEQAAVMAIYEKCCVEEGSCIGWPRINLHKSALKKRKGRKDKNGVVHVPVNTDLCHELGNICNSQGRLTRMTLRGFGLECEFPLEEFMTFKALEKLELTGNDFTGDVEKVLDGLATSADLSHLGLAFNDLTGSISSSSGLCDLAQSSLLFLDLQRNAVEGPIPACLLETGSKLVDIVLTATNMGGTLPDVFPADSPLEGLHIAAAGIEGSIPETLANLQMLTVLDLAVNSLTGAMPTALSGMPSLHTLIVSSNKLTSLPDAWNDPDTEIPDSLSVVSVDVNNLEGVFPAALAKAKGLDILGLSGNLLEGTLPDEEGLFPALEFLNISDNKFEGGIPSSWESSGPFLRQSNQTDSFSHLDFRDNKLSGELPEFFYPGTNISAPAPPVVIFVAGNDLTCRAGERSLLVVDDASCVGSRNGRRKGKKNKAKNN